MSISREAVAKVASLARLALSAEELERMTGEMTKIVAVVEQLAEVDTSAVEPLAHPLDAANVFRADEPLPCLTTAEALQSAPRHDGECFLVPAVLGESGAA